MNPDIDALVKDLKTLRKGLGVHDVDLPTNAGVTLRHVCGVAYDDPPLVVREKIHSTLDRVINELPKSRRLLGRDMFALDGADDNRYSERLKAHGQSVDRDLRTMQRKADEVLRLIAERLVTEGRPVTRRVEPPWHTKSLAVTLILTGREVEVIETRKIVSHVSDLAEIEHSLTVPPVDPNAEVTDLASLGIDRLGGGEVHTIRLVASNRVAFQLRPPQVLGVHQEHEFSFRLRVARINPFYVCTPTYTCDRFTLRVLFGREHTPTRIWLIDGDFSMEAGDPRPVRTALTTDSNGEVTAEFEHLEPAKSYGIGWKPVTG